MTDILVDRIASLGLVNGIVRVECSAISSKGQERHSGTLLIPANQAGPILQTLISSMQELQKQIKDRAGQAAT
jgi:hypothetical protein